MAAIRNLFNFNGVLYAVRGSALLSIDSSGNQTNKATIGSIGGPVDMAQNVTQLVIGDGAQMYVWNGATLTTISTYVLGDSLAFIDQRIVFPNRNTQTFQWTSLADATVIDPLSFASAEGSPDPLIAVIANLRELLLLGSSTGEVWHSVQGETVFERSQSEYLQVGCAAARSALVVGDTPVWLGQDENGQAQVMGGRGQRLSNRAIEERFQGIDLAQSRAFTWTYGPHQFYMLNVPGVETTLCFDVTYKQWFEAAELIAGSYNQWRPTCHAFAYGQHFFGADNGKIYQLNPESNDFDGDVKVRDRISPVMSSASRKRLRFPKIEFVQEKATGGTVMLRYSDDNGYNWSNWKYLPAGAVGNYTNRVASNRNGSSFDRVYQARMTDDVAWNPVMVTVDAL